MEDYKKNWWKLALIWGIFGALFQYLYSFRDPNFKYNVTNSLLYFVVFFVLGALFPLIKIYINKKSNK